MPITPTALIAPSWRITSAQSDPIVNVFAVMKLGSAARWTPPQLENAIDVLGSAWTASVGLQLSDDMVCDSVSAIEVNPGAAFTFEKSPEEGDFSNIDQSIPADPWECALVSYQTLAPGRSGRGRSYVAGLWKGAISTSGLIEEQYRQDLATQFEAFHTAIETSTEVPMVRAIYSRKNDTVDAVAGVSVRPMIALMRDRRAGSQ